MVKSGYSEEFKRVAVQKYLSRGNRQVIDLATDLGVGTTTLWKWVKLYKNGATSTNMKELNKRPQDWSAEEKIRACFEYEGLETDKQGEFLRREGLHSNHLQEWKELWRQALSIQGNNTASRAELNEANRKIKELERDLSRKNSALAETSALLILKKKADLIWGSEERA